MRIIISGGGTGGHIYPAISICQTILNRNKNSKILYVGKKDSLEEDLATKAGLSFCTVEALPFSRNNPGKMIQSLKALNRGKKQSKKIIKEFKPDIVMGTGGYVSLPVVLAAQKMHIPTAIHEANSIPGLANRVLSRNSKAVFITLEESRDRIKTKGEIILSGNPVRDDFLSGNYKNVEEFHKDKHKILSFGGSGGQNGLNNAVSEIIKEDLLGDEFELLHLTGKRHYENFVNGLGEYNNSKYIIKDYSNEMPSFMNAADLIISSSGMMTLTEISASSKPSILVPKPYTTENHQLYNAKAYENAGAAAVLEEKDMNGQILAKKILELFVRSDKLISMGIKSFEMFNPNSNSIIYEVLERIK